MLFRAPARAQSHKQRQKIGASIVENKPQAYFLPSASKHAQAPQPLPSILNHRHIKLNGVQFFYHTPYFLGGDLAVVLPPTPHPACAHMRADGCSAIAVASTSES